jgi:hypothetical protein
VLQGSEAARAIVGSPDGGRGTAARFEARGAFARDGGDRFGIRTGRRDADAAAAAARRHDTDTKRKDAAHTCHNDTGRNDTVGDIAGRDNAACIGPARVNAAGVDLAFADLSAVDARIGNPGGDAIDRVP